MRAVFFCGHKSPYGLAHLRPILQNFDVLAVVAATDARWAHFRRQLSGLNASNRSIMNPTYGLTDAAWRIPTRFVECFRSDLKLRMICRSAGVSIWWTGDTRNPEFVQKISTCAPDVILSAAYPRIFDSSLLNTAIHGGINFHPAPLPLYRGAHPHFWAIANGATEGGITAHLMTEVLDGGPIISQILFPIDDSYYYSDYYRAILERTPALVRQVKEFLLNNRSPVPQIGEGSYYRNDRDIHHRILWNQMTVQEIRNLVRTEAAFGAFRNRLVWIRCATLSLTNRNMTNGVSAEPGTIVDINESGIVLAAKGGFLVATVFSDGFYNQSFARWAARHRLRIGECFN